MVLRIVPSVLHMLGKILSVIPSLQLPGLLFFFTRFYLLMIFVYVSVLVYAYVWAYTPVRTFRGQKKAPDILLYYLPTIPLR